MTRLTTVAAIGLLVAPLPGCQDQAAGSGRMPEWAAPSEHETLAGSFAGGDTAGLRHLLHADLVVQPPEPENPRQGSAAIDYLLQLAAATTTVDQSRLAPTILTPEGPFAFEQGIWHLRVGDRALRSPYTLRWRGTSDGWKVVLWRWGAFR